MRPIPQLKGSWKSVTLMDVCCQFFLYDLKLICIQRYYNGSKIKQLHWTRWINGQWPKFEPKCLRRNISTRTGSFWDQKEEYEQPRDKINRMEENFPMPIAIPTTMDACHQVMLVKIFKFFVWWVAFIARSHLFRALVLHFSLAPIKVVVDNIAHALFDQNWLTGTHF